MNKPNPKYFKNLISNWDKHYKTTDCPFCDGTGMCDEHNECGFCDQPSEGFREDQFKVEGDHG